MIASVAVGAGAEEGATRGSSNIIRHRDDGRVRDGTGAAVGGTASGGMVDTNNPNFFKIIKIK